MAETGSVKVKIDDESIKGRMREFLAQAWDEGMQTAGDCGCAHDTACPFETATNPYRP